MPKSMNSIEVGTYVLTAITNNKNYSIEVQEANLIIFDDKAREGYGSGVLVGTAIVLGGVIVGIVIALIRRRIRIKNMGYWI